MRMKAELSSLSHTPPVSTLPNEMVRVTLSSTEDCILSGQDLFEENIQNLNSSTPIQWFCKNGATVYKNQNIASLNIKPQLCLEKTFLSALQLLAHLSGLATLTHCYVSTLKLNNRTKIKVMAQRKEVFNWVTVEQTALRHGGGEGYVQYVEDMNILANLDLLQEQKGTVFACRNTDTIEYLLKNMSTGPELLAFHHTMKWQKWITKIPNNIKIGLWGDIPCNNIMNLSHNRLDFILPAGLSYPPPVDLFLKCS